MIINSIRGGTVTLQDNSGNQVSLEIPPYALKESMDITLTSINTPPPNPFTVNLYPGIIITPNGIKLERAATLGINFASSISNPDLSYLFYLKRPDLASPVYRIEASSE